MKDFDLSNRKRNTKSNWKVRKKFMFKQPKQPSKKTD